MDELSNIPFGWSVNTSGYIVGKHLSDSFQDPTLAFPALQGAQYRTTLVKGDDVATQLADKTLFPFGQKRS